MRAEFDALPPADLDGLRGRSENNKLQAVAARAARKRQRGASAVAPLLAVAAHADAPQPDVAVAPLELPKCIACPADGGRCCRAMSLNMDPRNFDERRAVVDVANLERQLEEGTSSGHSSALRPEALRQYHRTKEQIDPGHHEGL